MSIKKHTTVQKIEVCKHAIQEKEKGTSISKTAKKLGLSSVTIHTWIAEYQKGHFNSESEIPFSLIADVTKECNEMGPVKIAEQLEIVVSFGDNADILIRIDNPGLENHAEQMAAIKENVFSRCDIFIKI